MLPLKLAVRFITDHSLRESSDQVARLSRHYTGTAISESSDANPSMTLDATRHNPSHPSRPTSQALLNLGGQREIATEPQSALVSQPTAKDARDGAFTDNLRSKEVGDSGCVASLL